MVSTDGGGVIPSARGYFIYIPALKFSCMKLDANGGIDHGINDRSCVRLAREREGQEKKLREGIRKSSDVSGLMTARVQRIMKIRVLFPFQKTEN